MSCSSEESGAHTSGLQFRSQQPRPSLMASNMEIPAALRNVQRKQSKVSMCKELSDTSGSPESGHYPTARKCSFMSRGMSEGKLASPSDTADSQSGTDLEPQHLTQGESPAVTPPPPASGRRMSMVRHFYRDAQWQTALQSCLKVQGCVFSISAPMSISMSSSRPNLTQSDRTAPQSIVCSE